MPFYFSSEKTAFYSITNPTTTPTGLVKITDETYYGLLNGQSNGKKITSDSDGYPILVDQDLPTDEHQWNDIKQKRNALLMETDWTQLPDVSANIAEKYKLYRQALRDITTQTDPFNIAWPIKPE